MIPWLCTIALLAGPSFCWAEGITSPPVVVVTGGEGGSGGCVDDGAGGLRCTLWAQGDWRRVTVDGVIVAERHRVALPLVR